MKNFVIDKLYISELCSTNRSFSRISPRETSVSSFTSWMTSKKKHALPVSPIRLPILESAEAFRCASSS